MRIRYDSEADVLLLILRDDPPVDAVEERAARSILASAFGGEPSSDGSLVTCPSLAALMCGTGATREGVC